MSLLSVAARTVADWMKLGFPEEVAKRIVSGELPMDKASRMKRAEEQGYDTSTPVYHGTDADFLEFDPERSSYGQLYSTTDKAAVESGEVGAAGHGVVKELYQNIQNPAGWDEYDNLFIDQIQDRGYDGIKLPDGDHTTMVVFDPKKYKSTDAAFDPQYKGANILGGADPRLLAGIAAGGGGVSAATALSNKLAAAQAVRERGDIRAPNSGMLHSLTMGARDLERRLEGHPAALLFPEGLVEYLEQANREERPSREMALWALLDMI